MGSQRSPENLLRDLSDPQKRFEAILSLGRARYAPAMNHIVPFINDPDPHVRWAVVQSLGWLGVPTSLNILIKSLADSDHWVRAAAARSLGYFQDDATIEPLIEALDDPEVGVRAAAAHALGLRGHPEALMPLSRLLSDETPDWSNNGQRVSDVARNAIGRIRQLHPDVSTPSGNSAQIWADWVLKNVLQLANADRGYVVMKNPQTGAMEYRAGEKVTAESLATPEFNVSKSVVEETLRSQEPLLTDNASQDSRYQGSESIIGFSLRQIAAVPLKSGDEVIGVVYVDKRLRDGILRPDDLAKITAFTEQALAPAEKAPTSEAIPDWLNTGALVDSHTTAADMPDWLATPDFEPSEIPDWLTSSLGISENYPAAAPADELDDAEIALDDSLRGGAAEQSSNPASLLDLDDDFDDDEIVLDDSLRGGAAEPELEAPAEAEESYEKAPKPITQLESDQPTRPQKPIASEVNFSAYYPAEAVAKKQQGLFVYAHLPELAPTIEKDVKQFREQLGGNIPQARVAKQSAQLQHGTLITVMPECDELDFEPAAVTKKWNGEWTRFDFSFTPKAEMVGDSLFVRVSISVSGVEIAHIKCPIEVIEQPQVQIRVDNPLAAAKLATQTAQMYHRIFVSYSRKDTQVAEAYRLAQMAIGNDVFMDSYLIRVGEDWRAALARAIDDADIFQLFWSSHAAESDNVHDEWDYALKYKCPDQNCTYFIRPVFWDKPMPQPPQPLSHLNFRYVPFAPADQTTSE